MSCELKKALPLPLRFFGIIGLREIWELIYGLQSVTGKILKRRDFGRRSRVLASSRLEPFFRRREGSPTAALPGDPSLRLNCGSVQDDVGRERIDSKPTLRLGRPKAARVSCFAGFRKIWFVGWAFAVSWFSDLALNIEAPIGFWVREGWPHWVADFKLSEMGRDFSEDGHG